MVIIFSSVYLCLVLLEERWWVGEVRLVLVVTVVGAVVLQVCIVPATQAHVI